MTERATTHISTIGFSIFTLFAILVPWLDELKRHRFHHQVFTTAPLNQGIRSVELGTYHSNPTHIFLLILTTLFAAFNAFFYYLLYRKLSAKIAEGGSEAAFMDNIRARIGSLAQGLATVAFLVAICLLRT